MLWKVKDFVLTESKLLLLSIQLGMETPSSLRVSCMCMGCQAADFVHIWPLELWHTSLKWFCIPPVLHVLPDAGHCLCMCTVPQYLQFTISILFLLSGLLLVSYLGFITPLCIVKVFYTFHLSDAFFCILCASIFGPMLVPAHCLFLVYFGGLLVLL